MRRASSKTSAPPATVRTAAISVERHTRGFLICTPGVTIRDRLRVVLPSDPDNYYKHRELVPNDLLGEIARAKIVITNYHSFKLRKRLEISKVSRSLLKGRGPELLTTETEGAGANQAQENSERQQVEVGFHKLDWLAGRFAASTGVTDGAADRTDAGSPLVR